MNRIFYLNVVIFAVVILIKKKVKEFKNDDELPKSYKEIAAEEVNRLLETVEEEKKEEE